MKRLKGMKNKKGFTLIEIIVVLVILAILAAATIPSMIGFVDEARGKAYASEARLGLVAGQAVVTKVVANGGSVDVDGNITNKDEEEVGTILEDTSFENMAASDVDGEFTAVTVDTDKSRVTGIVYKVNDYTITIADGDTTVEKDE